MPDRHRLRMALLPWVQAHFIQRYGQVDTPTAGVVSHNEAVEELCDLVEGASIPQAALIHALQSERHRWSTIRRYAHEHDDWALIDRMDMASQEYAERNRVIAAPSDFVSLPPFTAEEVTELAIAVEVLRKQLRTESEQNHITVLWSLETALKEGLAAHRHMVDAEAQEPTEDVTTDP